MQINLTCPACGMSLTEPQTQGFILNNETFCCRGCAEQNECTCDEPRVIRQKTGNRPGDLGQRNPENSTRDKNENEEVDTSGRRTGVNKQETRTTPRRIPSHGTLGVNGTKRPRKLSKDRSSTREESRGRSEFRGALNNSRVMDRIGVTGTKSS